MALQYVNKQTIGTLYINDAGDVTVDGVAKPGAVVTKGTEGALRVQVDGQTVDIGWDEDTVPLTDVASPPVADGNIGADVHALLAVLEPRLPGITHAFEQYASPPQWDAETEYKSGDRVQYRGKYHYALPDVAVGYAPDAIFDLATQTGGWAPL